MRAPENAAATVAESIAPPPAAEMPRWIEMATAILLSAAGLATAWASYQAALWGGEQAASYSVASAKVTDAAKLDLAAGQTSAIDTALFVSWIDAALGGQPARMDFLEKRFSPAFATAFAPWRAQFPEDLEGYRLPNGPPEVALPRVTYASAEEAARLRTEATRLFALGDEANAVSDRYVAITVLLSTVLFLAGIGQLLKRKEPRIAVLGLAATLGILSTIWMLTLPIEAL